MKNDSDYHYDFSYSIAVDMSEDPVEGKQGFFMEWSEMLLNMRLISNPETSKIFNVLFRLPAYRQIGLNLLKLV